MRMQKPPVLQNELGKNTDITFTDLASDYPAIVVNNAHAKAVIALHGAHLIEYTPHHEEPVIFTSKAAIFQEGKAIRGGIPICWPWFNAHPNNTDLPAHGYARNRFWKLDRVDSYDSGTSLIFHLPRKEDEPLAAQLEMHIGETLILTLTTTNHGSEPETYSEALHAYFSVTDSRKAELHGLDGRRYINTVGEETRGIQEGILTFPDEVDLIFHNDEGATLKDLENNRQIYLSKTGSNTTIAWNPGKEKGSSMADLHESEIHQFICVEAGNARRQSITLAPKQEHTIQYHICTAITSQSC